MEYAMALDGVDIITKEAVRILSTLPAAVRGEGPKLKLTPDSLKILWAVPFFQQRIESSCTPST